VKCGAAVTSYTGAVKGTTVVGTKTACQGTANNSFGQATVYNTPRYVRIGFDLQY
jgi:hypothetical protein